MGHTTRRLGKLVTTASVDPFGSHIEAFERAFCNYHNRPGHTHVSARHDSEETINFVLYDQWFYSELNVFSCNMVGESGKLLWLLHLATSQFCIKKEME